MMSDTEFREFQAQIRAVRKRLAKHEHGLAAQVAALQAKLKEHERPQRVTLMRYFCRQTQSVEVAARRGLTGAEKTTFVKDYLPRSDWVELWSLNFEAGTLRCSEQWENNHE